jgi:hypothetical protein
MTGARRGWSAKPSSPESCGPTVGATPRPSPAPGSTRERALAVRDDVAGLLCRLDVRVLLDVACGDFNWMNELALSVEQYVGIDIVPELIGANQKKYGTRGRSFVVADLIADRLPRADLILCRDALVHFPHWEVRAALNNFRRSGSTWLLATHFSGPRPNDDIPLGEWRPLNLERPPFCLPPPIEQIGERLTGEAEQWSDKLLALWRLADLSGFDWTQDHVRGPVLLMG